MDQPKYKGMDRRTFIKTSSMIGLGVAASSFGVPKLLRAANVGHGTRPDVTAHPHDAG